MAIDLGSPGRDVLEQFFHVSRLVERAVEMLVDQSDAAMMQAAVERAKGLLMKAKGRA